MTVDQFIQSTVEGPGALSPEGLAFHEKRVAEAEAALKEARRLVAVADAKAAALAKKQAAINSRLGRFMTVSAAATMKCSAPTSAVSARRQLSATSRAST